MAKQKSFLDKVAQKVRRDAGGVWTGAYLEELRELGDISFRYTEGISRELVTEDFFPELQMEALVRVIAEREHYEQGRYDDEPFIYPGLMMAWSAVPTTVTFRPELIERVREAKVELLGAPLADLRGLFPACLLVDVRPWGMVRYRRQYEALFIYPSFDSDRNYDLLLILAVNLKEGLRIPLESKLVLKGETLADALDATIAERELLRGRCLAGIDDGLHDEIFSPFEDEESVLFLALDALGLMLSPWCDVERSEGNRGVRLVAALSDMTVGGRKETAVDSGPDGREESAASQQDASTAEESERDLPEAAAEDGSQDVADAAGPFGPADVATSACSDIDEDLGPASAGVSEFVSADSTDVHALPGFADVDEAAHAGLARVAEEAPVPAADEVFSSASAENPASDVAGELARLRSLLAAQESKTATLEYHLKQARSAASASEQFAAGVAARAAVLESMDLPQTPMESLLLSERAFPDRLVFLPAARKSAEEFRKGSAAEVWAVLRSMAVVLHPLVFGRGGGNIIHAFESQSGFELTLREMKHIKKSSGLSKLRAVIYKGVRHDASAHVKGKGSKRGETLRVHFFADYDENRLVITHCGEHLTTYDTPSL